MDGEEPMPQAPQIAPVSQNRLLAALPPEELERLMPQFQLIPLVFKETLFEAGARIEYLYFPFDGVISTLAVMRDGSSTEVGMVGKEGATDIAAALRRRHFKPSRRCSTAGLSREAECGRSARGASPRRGPAFDIASVYALHSSSGNSAGSVQP